MTLPCPHCLFSETEKHGRVWPPGSLEITIERTGELESPNILSAVATQAGRRHLGTVLYCSNPLPVLSLPSFINSVHAFKRLLYGRHGAWR